MNFRESGKDECAAWDGMGQDASEAGYAKSPVSENEKRIKNKWRLARSCIEESKKGLRQSRERLKRIQSSRSTICLQKGYP